MFYRLNTIKTLLSLLSIAAIYLLYGSTWNLSVYFPDHGSSRSCDCHTCLGDGDPWFKETFNAVPRPFLSKTHRTSLEEYNWWKTLQYDHRNFTQFNATVEKLFKIFPPVPDVVESNPDRCVSCAVVGNSGNLKRSHYGPLIDAHDLVIRMNHGRTKGFEKDVGTRTTHHILYPESAINLPDNTSLVLFPFKTTDLLWLINKFKPSEGAAGNTKRIANKDLVMILNPAFMKHVHQNWLEKKGRYPSTGFMTVILSLFMCDQISVFGFGADNEGNWNHYYEILKNHNLRTGPHPGAQEYGVMQKLNTKKKIRLYTGF
ncbi:CMP-N-acetylneuraminate-beta-galactosamide-alpha-2,3-sialyltransferase 1-like isoform X1 [Trematomus bernacchii]|uniref:CMP-N-acetylneuraminate-beta-galactosamide- alpha-2,3-sialyltransferase 1-like isoform X1 n=1 Tax=Trematomus bernacchii TaxID=40690 RepID=UPI00146C4C36|nr:CMP-N-acetylneuraminate-beta-galactosamide-alpha-2,3-sialyltransferase 1-like isoform X1 [Trematomus bernacchii]XP_033986995.1 CMP-N-acetylneuraminate-beta-galactosamide-alpha-2,3-sialyltransferase 1-like isoform X1 [Trematomus bernacchii]XP_033986996.1 CMP-N-acetylneuraminate-beta-galactosamide-alpha-2,3-sialyltransferase 1-like isoform X1 [Trematomus bernacchii]